MISDMWPHNRLQKELDRRFMWRMFRTFLFVVSIVSCTLFVDPYKAWAYNVTYTQNSDTANLGTANGVPMSVGDGSFAISIPDFAIPSGSVITQVRVKIHWRGASRYAFHITNNAGTDQDAPTTPCSPTPSSPTVYNTTTCVWSTGNNGWNFLNNVTNLNTNLNLRGIRFTGTGNSADIDHVYIEVDVDAPQQVILTSTGSLQAGASRLYTAEWSGMFGTGAIKHVFWYPYGRQVGNCGGTGNSCPYLERIINNVEQPDSITGTGSVSWNFAYPYAGTYSGSVIVTPDCGEFSVNVSYDSCEIFRDTELLTIGGISNDDDLYPNILLDFPVHSGEQGTNRLITESQPYEWRIDSGMCADSSVSGVRLFKGYPYPQSNTDIGTVLAGTSGSGSITFDFESPSLKSWFYPSIHVYCSDGSYHDIYNGSTTHKNNATGLYIVDSEWTQYWVNEWEVGGQSTDYSPAGSGAQLWVDKDIYERYEPVRMKFEYNVNFTPHTIVFYPDPSQVSEFFTSTDPDLLLEKTTLNYTIEYQEAGTYFPKIQVRSSSYNPANPATYRDIWLGGNQTKDNNVYLTVTRARYTQSEFATDDGIFGLDPSSFSVNFGDSDNIAIKLVETVVTYITKAALWVASFAYSAVKDAPVFSLFIDTVNPPDGICYQMPSSLWSLEIPSNLDADGEFCVNYASDSAMFSSTLFAVQLIVGMSLMFYIFRKFF